MRSHANFEKNDFSLKTILELSNLTESFLNLFANLSETFPKNPQILLKPFLKISKFY